MKIEDVNGTKDLMEYIKIEVAKQTVGRPVTVKLELPEKLYFKFIKLILFYIKDRPDERYRDWPIEEESKRFNIRVNGFLTKVYRK